MSYDAQEADNDAKRADVGCGYVEWRVFGVVGDALDVIRVVRTFKDTLNELPLAAVDDVDIAPLEEKDVAEFAACHDVAILVSRYHGLAGYSYKELRPFSLEFRDAVAFT